MNCNYKVKIKDIQTKYKFKVFCTGYDDSEIKEKIDTMYEAWPKATAEGETPTLDNTANATMSIDLKGNTSQSGEPTPDAPIPVNVVSGDNTINVCGRNLAYTGWAEDFVSRINDSSRATITTKDNRRCLYWVASAAYPDYDNKYTFTTNWKENTQYTILFDLFVNSTNGYGDICIEYTDGTRQEINGTYNTWVHKTTTSTSGKTIKNIHTYYRSENSYIDLDTFMVYEGTETLPYEPYQSQSYAVNLGSMELCKIGDYQDYIYKEGKKWYKYGAIGKDNVNIASTTTYQSKTAGIMSLASKISNANSGCYCTKAKWVNRSLVNANTNEFYDNANNVVFVGTAEDTLETLQTKFNNSPIYYILKQATYTEITDTTLISQLEALKKAESYSGQTNISQTNDDKPFILTVKALKDLSNLGTSTVSTLNTASVNRLGTPVFNQSIDPVNLEINSEDLELNNEEETIEETPEER